MKIFVTGATGFIGAHFVNQAISEGHEVIGLRRTEKSSPRTRLMREPIWINKSLDELNETDFSGTDCLVHLAAHTPNFPYDTLENCLYWNLQVPIAMTRSAHRAGVTNFVVAGSCFEYGRSGEKFEFIPTDAPLEPTSSYPVSKAAASIAFKYLASELGLKMSIHRIFQVFGEGEAESRFWPSLKKAAQAGKNFPMTEGKQIRDFVPVEFVASHLLEATSSRETKPGVCIVKNVGSGDPLSLRQFAEKWWQHWGAIGNLQFGAVAQRPNEIMRFVPELS